MATLQSTLRMSLIDDVTAKARRINSVFGQFRRQQMAFANPLRGMMGQVVAFGGAYLGVTNGFQATAGSAMEFEDAFADVKKVLNGSDEQLANIRRQIIGMSKELPIAATGIAEIYAAAGQANIPIQEISKFSEMVAKVSTAWDIPVAETGQALAEIRNQLQLSVSEVGLFADSLNHLSNNSPANATRLLAYSKRVAATGEMFGFSAQQSLAFGGAMIASGAEAEVAATSFRNMGRALVQGDRATKSQREALGALKLDAVKTAKAMQKDALKTTIDVIERIQTLPEWQRISIASALFGDEARALMPLINNSSELRRQLNLVGKEANYAGSAFQEYLVRADTTSNVLQILRNKFADVFRGFGDRMLPTIKQAALGIGDILDTLGERVSIFDKMSAAMQGFMNGLGMDGGVREMINDLGDLLFGEVDGSGAADKLGRIFMEFKEWGASVRELNDALQNNPIAQFFGDIAGYGFDALKWSIGIILVAGAVRKLASALFFLSGASTILGALKVVKGIAGIAGIGGGAAATTAAATAGGATAATAGKAAAPGLMALLRTVGAGLAGVWTTAEILKAGKAKIESDPERQERQNQHTQQNLQWLKSFFLGDAAKENFSFRDAMGVETKAATNSEASAKTLTADALRAANAPQRVQDVRVTNRQPPEVRVTNHFTITEASSAQAVADEVMSRIGGSTKSAVESSYSD